MINDYARVEDDELIISGTREKKQWNGRNNDGSDNNNGRFDKTKQKRKGDYNIVSDDGYKGINTVFTKLIHKIMFNIQHKPYFEWPKAMGKTRRKGTINWDVSTIRITVIRPKIVKP